MVASTKYSWYNFYLVQNIYSLNIISIQKIFISLCCFTAHPKIKLFIYQGGLQSSEETIRFAVPVLGFPILADQDYQVRRMEALGIGKYLEITTFTEDQLENAIYEIINNKK